MKAVAHPFAARREALRRLVADRGLDGLLVTDLTNISYLTGFTGSNAALVVGPQSTFCTDSRYELQSAEEVPDLPRIIARPCDLALLATVSGQIGFESHVVSVASHADMVGAGSAVLVATAGPVEELRAIKDSGEIELLRQACAVADRALAQLIDAGGIRAGRTEREIGLDLDQRMRVLGATDPAFETIVAAGANSAIPHHRPTAAVLGDGDFVKLDFGAAVDGYHSDMTRTFVLGRAADWQREIYGLVHTAQLAGRNAAVVEVSGGQIDAAARDVIEQAGYGGNFGHGLGHGIGLEVHEAPSLARGAAGKICKDMCVTVEPGVYLPGRGGVRIEDSGVVRADGYEVLTLTSRDLTEL